MSNSGEKLESVFWLGGSPCTGKTSISEVLAGRFGLDVYHVDEAFEVHAQGFDLTRQPALTKWATSSWDQRWMQPIDILVQEVIACYQEHFALVLEDLASLPERPWLVEGCALLPRQVVSVLSNHRHAIWVIPTRDFQLAHYSKRDWMRRIVAQCISPEAAFHRWMERDIRFAKWVEEEARVLDLTLLTIEGNRSIEETAEAVATHFQLLANQTLR